ncbi:MAG: aldo/keto reductase [Caldilineaceae bacterium]|nr:aldo/keto reductase [Caldilineaceae bacterium]
MLQRTLGRSGIEVSGLGLGCWAIGGPFWRGNQPVGWGEVDDNQSRAALERALELGVTFFDTSDVYGCGHSERILGQVLAERRKQVVIATKFGNIFDEQTRRITGASAEPTHIRRACEASLRRLRSEYIDLYQLHIGNYDLARVDEVLETLEELVDEGKIRWYGWSTDDPARAEAFSRGPHCAAIQQRFNLFEGNAQTLAVCEEAGLASVVRGPLAQGLLTGKFNEDSTLPSDDVRHSWDFHQGEQAKRLQALGAIREVLSADKRTLAQGALAWLWARSKVTIPIPGFKRVEQVEENAAAMWSGALSSDQMAELDELMAEAYGRQR